MFVDVALLLSHCQESFTLHGGLYSSLALAGLIGGLTHCATMCGPFVAAQTHRRCELCPKACHSMMARYRHAALLPYHAGRITTYMLLGIVAAFLSRQLLADALHQWISAFLLVAAGSMFLLTSLSGLTGKATRMTAGWWERWGNLLAHSARPFFVHPVGVRGYGLGMLLGLIPCGLIFAALMAVSATGDAISGALGMLVFGLGTVPALLIVGLGSQYATARWPGPVRKLIHGLMALNGISLMAIAGRLVW